MTTLIKLKNISWLVIFIFSLVIKAVASEKNVQNDSKIDLLLAGGTLPVCSSFSQKNCADESFSSQALTQLLYKFDTESITRFNNSDFYNALSKQDKLNINSLLEIIYSKSNNQVLTKNEVSKLLRSSKFKTLFLELPDSLYFSMFDFFEVRQLDNNDLRKTEKVVLANSNNNSSKLIFETFHQQAVKRAKQKGKAETDIIVITASSRDPFESADFYQGVFANLNAKTLWLPLDSSLQRAIEFSRCDQLEQIRQDNLLFDRARIYPQRTKQQLDYCLHPKKLLEAIKQADGIFFNGGDQSRTLAALVNSKQQPTEVLTLIEQQVKNGQLIVAGTSAGTAVQAGGKHLNHDVVMVTNGDPQLALSRGAFSTAAPSVRCSETGTCPKTEIQHGDLTYIKGGGTGLFNLGLLDTHFSERDREVRLTVLATMTNNQFGYGVDETTALAVSFNSPFSTKMQVIGENGVFVIDVKDKQSSVVTGQKNYVSGISYYLNHGDTMQYDHKHNQLNVSFAKTSALINEQHKAKYKPAKEGIWRANVSKHCGSKEIINWQLFNATFALKASNQSQFALNSKGQCSYANLPFVISM